MTALDRPDNGQDEVQCRHVGSPWEGNPKAGLVMRESRSADPHGY